MLWPCSFFISVSRKDYPREDYQTRLQAYSKNVDSSRLCHIANQGFQAEENLLENQAKKGSKVAAVALARKVLCILHHLLMNQEMYLEDRDKKNMRQKPLTPPSPIEMSIQEMINCIVRAGYVVTKSDSIGGFG